MSPDSFNGDCLFFKFTLRYCPPYEQDRFRELKRLQEVAYSNVRFKNEYKGFIVIDITEWIGHFEEELFQTITMSFLCDMSDCWKYIFVASNLSKDDFSVLNKFFKVKNLGELQQEKNDAHNSLVASLYNHFNIRFSPEATGSLRKYVPANIISSKETAFAIMNDIKTFFGSASYIDKQMLLDYLSNSDGMCFEIISEKNMIEIKARKEENDHEKL